MLSDITSAYVNFTKEEYKGYIGVVTTNPIIGIIRKIIRFQEKIVSLWHPKAWNATSIIIPTVLLGGEIIKNGNGMAIIEILCLSGLLMHIKSDNDRVLGTMERLG